MIWAKYTVKPVCNDHLYNIFFTCDLFINVFWWRLNVPIYSCWQFLPSGAQLGGQGPPRWAPESREVSHQGGRYRQVSLYMPHLNVAIRQVNRSLFNSSLPSATYMRQCTGSSLVHIMACRLLGAKPLPEPVLGYYQLDSSEQISVKFESEFHRFQSRECVWKCRLPKWWPFCPGEMS